MNKHQDFIKQHNISPLGFGLMRLPTKDGEIDLDTTKEMVDAYMAAGHNYFDTAYMYHGGKSEIALKHAVVERYPRESFIVVDKLPVWSCETPEDVERIFNEQLERCGVEYFDIYLLHALNGDLTAKCECIKAFEFCAKMKAEGKIKLFGYSFHGTTEDIRNIMSKYHEQIDIVQLQLNYFDWLKEYREQFDIIAGYNKPVVCMEPVRGGLLARLPEKQAAMLKEANPNVSQASWAIRWVASVPEIANVLSGMSNMEQMRDNIATAADLKPLSTEERAVTDAVAKALAEMPQIKCTACNYCTNCPLDIPIADIIGHYNKYLETRSSYTFGMEYRKIDKAKNAAACTGCGVCVDMCPQNIDIPAVMREIAILMDA